MSLSGRETKTTTNTNLSALSHVQLRRVDTEEASNSAAESSRGSAFSTLVSSLDIYTNNAVEMQGYVEQSRITIRNLRAGLAHLETLSRRLQSEKCEVVKGDGQLCQQKGKVEHLQFCGIHRRNATDLPFLRALLLAQYGLDFDDDHETCAADAVRFILDPANRLHVAKCIRDATDHINVGLEDEKKEELESENCHRYWLEKAGSTRAELAKLKGEREKGLFHEMEKLKIRVEPFYGDFSMNGPSCLKFIKHFPIFAALLDGESQEIFLCLFESLDVLVGFLFTTVPLRAASLSLENWEFLHGPLTDPNVLLSDLEYFESRCHEHGDFFSVAFQDVPPPKHHFLVFHAAQFARRFGNVGMFSEQGMERSHSACNDLNRKLRPIAEQTKKLQRKLIELTAKASLQGSRKSFDPFAIHQRK